MKRSKERFLRRLLPESPGLWLLALAITAAMWAAVHMEQNQVATVDVPLMLSLPKDKVLVSDVPEKIKVTMSGPWTQLTGMDRDKLGHEIDLSGSDLGPSLYYLDPDALRLPPRTRAIRVSPSQLRLSFARKSSRLVPVVPNLVGQPARGYAVKGFTCGPKEVTIEGAESEVGLLDEAVTEEIDIVNRTQSFEAEVGLFPLSRNVWAKEKARFKVQVTIEPVVGEDRFTGVAVRVDGTEHEVRVTPDTVSVALKGPEPSLERLSSKKLTAVVELAEQEGKVPGRMEKTYRLEGLPEGVQPLKLEPERVRIRVLKKMRTP